MALLITTFSTRWSGGGRLRLQLTCSLLKWGDHLSCFWLVPHFSNYNSSNKVLFFMYVIKENHKIVFLSTTSLGNVINFVWNQFSILKRREIWLIFISFFGTQKLVKFYHKILNVFYVPSPFSSNLVHY